MLFSLKGSVTYLLTRRQEAEFIACGSGENLHTEQGTWES